MADTEEEDEGVGVDEAEAAAGAAALRGFCCCDWDFFRFCPLDCCRAGEAASLPWPSSASPVSSLSSAACLCGGRLTEVPADRFGRLAGTEPEAVDNVDTADERAARDRSTRPLTSAPCGTAQPHRGERPMRQRATGAHAAQCSAVRVDGGRLGAVGPYQCIIHLPTHMADGHALLVSVTHYLSSHLVTPRASLHVRERSKAQSRVATAASLHSPLPPPAVWSCGQLWPL